MTDSQIQDIRDMRALGVKWAVIARKLRKSVQECRQALGLPEYESTERRRLPWEQVQLTLFDNDSEGQL